MTSHLSRNADRTGFAIALVAAAAILVYLNSLANGFAFDDEFIILNNARVHDLGDLSSIWLTPYWPGFDAEAGLYRPLAIFAYALEWSFGSGSPFVFHAMNVLLHALTSVLGYLVLRRFTGALPALTGAFFFALHPVHVEAVANAVGQAELLAGAAILGACALHLRPAQQPRGLMHALLLAGLYAAALLAKESAIVLPALLVAGDAALGRVSARREDVARYARAAGGTIALLTMVAAGYILMRVAVLGSFTGGDAAPSLPFLRTGQRFLVALQTWPEYVRLLVLPLDLSADYSPGVIVPAAGLTPPVLAGAALLLVTALLALRVLSASPAGRFVAFAAAWFFIAILPVSNLVVPVGVVLAERTLYVPSFALSIAVAAAVARLATADVTGRSPTVFRRFPSPAFVAIAASAVLLLFAGRTVLRNPDWRDTPAYWNALIRDHPESYRAQWGLGANLIVNGRAEEGFRYMELAAETWPHDPHLLVELGGLRIERGQPARALDVLHRAWEAGLQEGRIVMYLGLASVAAGDFDKAMAWSGLARTSTASAAERSGAEALRAQALDGLGRPVEAAAAWRAAIEAAPGRSFTYWMMLARAHGRAGDAVRALAAADTARGLASDAAAVARVDRLRDVIVLGCWKDSGPANTRDRCADPLEDWMLVTPTRAIIARREESAP